MSCCSLVAKFGPHTHQPCMTATQPPQLTSRDATCLSQHANTIQMLLYTIHAQNSAASCSISAILFHRLSATANTSAATGLPRSPNPVLTLSYLPAAWSTSTKLYNSFLTFVDGIQCLYIQKVAVNTILTRHLSTYCRIQLHINLANYIQILVTSNVISQLYSNLLQCSLQALPAPCFYT